MRPRWWCGRAISSKGFFQPTIATAFGLGRGWGAIWPFFLAGGAAVVLAVAATPRLRLSSRSIGWGVLWLVVWAVLAAVAPTLLGIDHQGLLSIQAAGDKTALHKGFGTYPLKTLAPFAALVGFLALAAMALLRNEPAQPRSRSAGSGESPGARAAVGT